MLDKIVLGLLHDQPHTAYSLQRTMEQSTGFFYSSSSGALHPALRKLVARGEVQRDDVAGSARGKVQYTLTDAGRETFQQWLGSPLGVGRVREAALVRLFFLGHLPQPTRRAVLDGYRRELHEQLAVLDALYAETDAALQDTDPSDLLSFRFETLRYGRDFFQFTTRWYDDLGRRDDDA